MWAVFAFVYWHKSFKCYLILGYLLNVVFVHWSWRISTWLLNPESGRFILTKAAICIIAVAPFIKYYIFSLAGLAVSFFYFATANTKQEIEKYNWMTTMIYSYSLMLFLSYGPWRKDRQLYCFFLVGCYLTFTSPFFHNAQANLKDFSALNWYFLIGNMFMEVMNISCFCRLMSKLIRFLLKRILGVGANRPQFNE